MATIRTGPAYTMADSRGWMAMVGISLPVWRGKLRAGVAEAEAVRAMSQADLLAMTRMIEGDAAGPVHGPPSQLHPAMRDPVVLEVGQAINGAAIAQHDRRIVGH